MKLDTSKLNIKEDYKLNLAQSLLFAMGCRPELLFAHIQEGHGTYTKRGPGRRSLSGRPVIKKEK